MQTHFGKVYSYRHSHTHTRTHTKRSELQAVNHQAALGIVFHGLKFYVINGIELKNAKDCLGIIFKPYLMETSGLVSFSKQCLTVWTNRIFHVGKLETYFSCNSYLKVYTTQQKVQGFDL